MWTFITQLLVTLVLLGFFLVSCQNVMHIVRGSLCFVLKHIHQELDKELGENEGLSDDEETISTRVVRRRVLLKVTTRQEAGLRAQCCEVNGEELGDGARLQVRRHVGREGPGRLRGTDSALGARAGCGPHLDHRCVMAEIAQLWDLAGLFSFCFCPQVTLSVMMSVEGLSTL